MESEAEEIKSEKGMPGTVFSPQSHVGEEPRLYLPELTLKPATGEQDGSDREVSK